MSRRLVQYIELTDDLDRESKAEEEVLLGIDGMVYELDLTFTHAKELRELLAPYLDAAHEKWKMPARKKVKKAPASSYIYPTTRAAPGADGPTTEMKRDRDARKRIRKWANENGYPVAENGIIRREAIQAFVEAHPRTYVPPSSLGVAFGDEES